jgi:hypothetical protein
MRCLRFDRPRNPAIAIIGSLFRIPTANRGKEYDGK